MLFSPLSEMTGKMKHSLITSILLLTFLCNGAYSQTNDSFAEFDGSTLILPALKFGGKIYKNLKLSYVQGLDFVYQSHTEEVFSDQKTNSIFDGQRIHVNLVKVGSNLYSSLILVLMPDGKLTAQSANTPLSTDELSIANRGTAIWVAYKAIRKAEIKDANNANFNQCDCTYNAIAYLDIDLDGDDDIFVGTIWWDSPYSQENVKRIPAEIYINNGDGSYTYDMSMIDGTIPSFVHPRKAVVSDFNGDLRPDIFVVDHGFNALPFPGESPWLIMSNPDGTYSSHYLNEYVGFHHSASVGDLDGDGDVDVLVTGFNLLVLLNDGNGNFVDGTNTFPDQLAGIGRLNTSEIYDINLDGSLDIIAACECLTESVARIWLGPEFTQVVNVRGVEPFETIVDILPTDIDKDGDVEIIFSITGSGSKNYQGAMIELVSFNRSDNSLSYETLYEENSPDNYLWVPWLKVIDNDGDGDLDILADNKSQGLILEQYESGSFRVITGNKKNW